VGTPYYFPPEVCTGAPDTGNAPPGDIWALGIVALELVCLKVPYEGQRCVAGALLEDGSSPGHRVGLLEAPSRPVKPSDTPSLGWGAWGCTSQLYQDDGPVRAESARMVHPQYEPRLLRGPQAGHPAIAHQGGELEANGRVGTAWGWLTCLRAQGPCRRSNSNYQTLPSTVVPMVSHARVLNCVAAAQGSPGARRVPISDASGARPPAFW
jgi:serine/threonine protein kinase